MSHCPYQSQAPSPLYAPVHQPTAPAQQAAPVVRGNRSQWLAKVPLPKVVQALWVIRSPEAFFRRRSGGAALFKMDLPGFSTIYVTGTAAGAREMLAAPSDVYRTNPGTPIDAVFGANSMMAVDGERHQRQRRLIIPGFGPGKSKDLSPAFAAITCAYVDGLVDGGVKPLHELMQELALVVIIEVIFGVSDDAGKAKFTAAISEFVAAATASLLLIPQLRQTRWPPWRRFLRAQAELDRCLLGQVRHLRSRPDAAPDSLLRLMLNTTDPNGDKLSDEELRDELRMLLVAGHETTATTMTWAVYYALANPKVYEQLCEEVRSAAGDVDADDALPYLGAVCNEALRIHSVPPFAFRTLRKPLEVCGQKLQPGTNLALSLMLLHSDPEVFPEPAAFKPERFLGHKYGLFEFLPFGSGVRRCIASSFAMTEMRVVLATMLRLVDVALEPAPRPRLVLKHINSGPDRAIPLRISKRAASSPH